jgi:putative phosphoesterase
MRVAVVSDIHGNLTALRAVIDDLTTMGPDLVVQGGDLVGNGARSAEVVDLVMDLGWPGIVGNTDEVLWDPKPLEDLAARIPAQQEVWGLVFEDVATTSQLVGERRMHWLRALPDRWTGHDLSVVHASPGNCWTGAPLTATDDELSATYGPLGSPLAVYGHIHQPFVRGLPGLTVANSGSVGLPYDGDSRASYLLIDDGRVTIRRVAYDIDAEIRELTARRYPNRDWVGKILRAGKYLPPS